MIDSEVIIVNRLGCTACGREVRASGEHLRKQGDGREGRYPRGRQSILGLLTLAAAKGTKLHLTTAGDDERQAADALVELVRSRFGELE